MRRGPKFKKFGETIAAATGSSSTIQPCLDEYSLVPLYLFKFKTIKEIQTIPVNSMVYLVGLVISISPTSMI